MTPTSNRAKSVFLDAIELSDTDQRNVLIDAECGGDAGLRREVDRLLLNYEKLGSFLEGPDADDRNPALPDKERPGTTIDRYQLLEEIGDGGMGVVYVAQQTEPIRRQVALKIIKPGMDTRQVVARFEAERQTLALMDHPHIAQVYDGGATASGRPYFVMELVRGVPITDFCDTHQRSTPQRLQLFIDVCQAIQHAHQKGIIHRDIKPSNVLVTLHDDVPVVKVIDFGVAKAIHQELVQQTVYTNFAQLIGTPLYMSPEQAEMNALDVDTRSDIYSLGVLLYELLTGATPFDRDQVHGAGFDEMRRMIREDDPPSPSQRVTTLDAEALSTVSHRRGVDQRQLPRLLRGELDWIVMKALQKNRGRRYATASALAQDVRNYLHHEPVEASPPSPWYAARKLLRRHRVLLTATLFVVTALSLGAMLATWQALAASRARHQVAAAELTANRHLRRALNAVDKMLSRVGDDILATVPQMEAVRTQLMDDAVELYGDILSDVPNETGAQLGAAVTERRKAELLHALGRTDQADATIQRSLDRLRKLTKSEPSRWNYQLELGRTLHVAGVIREDIAMLQEAVRTLQRLKSADEENRALAIDLTWAISKLALEAAHQGDIRQAHHKFVEADRILATLSSEFPGDRELQRVHAKHLINLGAHFGHRGDWQTEEELHNRALRIGKVITAEDPQPEDRMIYATALSNRALAALRRGGIGWPFGATKRTPGQRDETPRDELARAIGVFRQLVEEHPSVPMYQERLAGAILNQVLVQDDPQRMVELSEESMELFHTLSENYPHSIVYRQQYAGAASNLARLYDVYLHDLPRAQTLIEKAMEQQNTVLRSHPEDPTSNQFLLNHYAVLAGIAEQREDTRRLLEICAEGIALAERIQIRYPENGDVEWILRRLTSCQKAATANDGMTSTSASQDPPVPCTPENTPPS